MICKVCNSDKYTKIGNIENIWQSTKEVYQCNNCKLYYIESPSDEEIYLLYKNEYHNNIKNKIFELAKTKMRYARSLSQFNFIKENINIENKKVCEIGAFDGLLLSIFKKNNCDVYGYELNDNAREYATKKYNIELRENFLNDNEKYDLIILSHVIEHFKEPKDILKKIKSMLNENGYIYIEVPNSPYKNECDYEMLMKYLHTEHTVNFNFDNLIQFVENEQFEIVKCMYNNYNIKNKNIAANILEGTIPNPINMLSFICFAINTIIKPTNTFINYSDKVKWVYGENIRLIARI